MSLEAGIWASRLGFEPQGWVGIMPPRSGYELRRGWTEEKKKKEKKKKEKFPLCVKA